MNKEMNVEERLNDLGARIDTALEKLKLQHVLYSEHGPTGEELKKRYEHIQQTVDAEAADYEAHGHHVSALERSFLEWMEHLQFDR